MIHVAVLPRSARARWARSRTATPGSAAYPSSEALPSKDFSIVPVCGSVRPSASQRRLSQP
ncbi:hypothetical protein [Phycicoccus sp. Soil802]|uniref:hypothetical protein n=1 Tax=Phycicoccus sp. Soil802 TaxID=1736414 RepID=UPI0007024783|nr:hypothetical protein [Phycicoccus sp. Soil802]KRF28982.1 hypothetical protein ASG91_04995 [Phycicoccus sp. Soil802]